jgi:hypothetical protein
MRILSRKTTIVVTLTTPIVIVTDLSEVAGMSAVVVVTTKA